MTNRSVYWDEEWGSTLGQDGDRQTVLNEVLLTLEKGDRGEGGTPGGSAGGDRSGDHAWRAKKEAAGWLADRAVDLDEDGLLLDKALKALIERANNKYEHPEVRQSARAASQILWEAGWQLDPADPDRENRRPDILRLILAALNEESDDPDDWRFRRITVAWLMNRAADLVINDSMAREAEENLKIRVMTDSDGQVRELAQDALAALWNAAWKMAGNREGKRGSVYTMVEEALGTDDRSGAYAWMVREAAVEWMGDHKEGISADDPILDRALEALIRRTKVRDEHRNVRQAARVAGQQMWEMGWTSCVSPDHMESRRPDLLRKITLALEDEGDDPEDWHFRLATVTWLRKKAVDLAANESMAWEALHALVNRMLVDPDDYVKQAVEKAIVAIWNAEWDGPGSRSTLDDRHLVLDQVLKTLATEKRFDEDVRPVKRMAADWLGKKAGEISGQVVGLVSDKMVVEVLEALIRINNGDVSHHPQLSRSASQASENIWNVVFLSGLEAEIAQEPPPDIEESLPGQNKDFDRHKFTPGQIRILRKILRALETRRDPELRLTAAAWLEKNAWLIGGQDYPVYSRVAEALAQISRDSTASDELKERVAIAQRALWTELEDERSRQLLVLTGGKKRRKTDRKDQAEKKSVSSDEDLKAIAIRQLSDRYTLGSREAVHQLIRIWVDWIRKEEEPRLVELTAEAVRYNKLAIPALIEAFDGRRKNGGTAQANKRVERRIAKQLADMSDPIFYEDLENPENDKKLKAEYHLILEDMRRLAFPVCLEKLGVVEEADEQKRPAGRPEEVAVNISDEERMREETEIRQHLVRTLAYAGGREAVDSLARLVVGKERERQANRDRLDEYYLKPSRERREEAAEILEGTVKESERTLTTLKVLNVLVFLVGLGVLWVGLAMFLFGETTWSNWLGFAAAFGGGTGIISLLVWDPLDRIQNSTANLVEVETAFTGFIWQLNLNQTLIQSRYINNGELKDWEIKDTAARIERAMGLTMNLVSTYTSEAEQRVVTRINRLEPASGSGSTQISVYGQYLLGDRSQVSKEEGRGGMVAVNHQLIPAQADELTWENDLVQFVLPAGLEPGKVWISLYVDGMETNALPFMVE